MTTEMTYSTEATPEGDQALVPGVEPVTERERLEKRTEKPLTGKALPMDKGLFDTGARDQLDLF